MSYAICNERCSCRWVDSSGIETPGTDGQLACQGDLLRKVEYLQDVLPEEYRFGAIDENIGGAWT